MKKNKIKKMGKQQKEKGLQLNMGKCCMRGRLVKILWNVPLVNIWWMLDCILTQNCRNTLSLHSVDLLVSSAKVERLLQLVVMKYVIIKCVETRIHVLEAELKMDAGQTVNNEKVEFCQA